jgi:hypothetical protein
MANFKEQFGLDYLGVRPSAPAQTRTSDPVLPQGLSEAVIAYSSKVIAALKSDPDKTLRLFDIAGRVPTRVEALLPVIKLLISEGYMERTVEDPVGNDTFRLTDSGQKIAV